MNTAYDTFSTPVGNFSVAVDAKGAVLATAFGGLDELRSRFACGEIARNRARIEPIRRQVAEYFSGERDTFDLPLAPAGSEFQQCVWAALQQIPPGETRSYGELAAALGRAGAARAVGRANATNPICLIVPCHRVIGSDGSLTGFAFGVEIKRKLLAHEGAKATARA
ncbi:MAG: methylated-DNA--protein-cysteine methyltransferase [Verrucomicrobia bacterium]|nr:methylated-DNA--protein-cysteine methyltransferase [Verrucomicrobiota bacterium]